MLRSKDIKDMKEMNAKRNTRVNMSYDDYKNDEERFFVVMSLPLVAYLKMRKFSYKAHLDINTGNVFYVFERSVALKDAVMDWNTGIFKVFASVLADTKQEAITVKEMETIKYEQGLV